MPPRFAATVAVAIAVAIAVVGSYVLAHRRGGSRAPRRATTIILDWNGVLVRLSKTGKSVVQVYEGADAFLSALLRVPNIRLVLWTSRAKERLEKQMAEAPCRSIPFRLLFHACVGGDRCSKLPHSPYTMRKIVREIAVEHNIGQYIIVDNSEEKVRDNPACNVVVTSSVPPVYEDLLEEILGKIGMLEADW